MAKSRSIGGIYASLSLRDGGFKSGLKSARKGLNEFGGTAIKGAAAGVAALGAGMAAAAVMGTKSTLSMVDDLGDVSSQTGVAIADMMLLQRAYTDGGRAAEMTGKDIGKMQRSIVGANAGGADPFASMGLSAEKLLQLNPADQFRQIGAAIMEISNPAERTAKAMEIFGKGGMGLVTVFGGIDGAVKSLGRMPELAQEFGAAMGEANDLIGHLPVKSDQFFVGFTAGIIGELLPGLKKIDDYDFTTMGQNIGAALSTAFESITDGSVWEIFQLQAEKAILAMQTSPVGNGVAAEVNAAWDWITGAPVGPNYLQMGIGENAEKIDEKQARIDEIIAAAATRFTQKQDAARTPETPESQKFHPEDFVPTKDVLESLQRFAESRNRDVDWSDAPSIAPRDVNSYQSRGLSLDANGAGRAVETTNTLLGNIRDILKQSNVNKQPVY